MLLLGKHHWIWRWRLIVKCTWRAMADAIGDPLRSSLTTPGHLSQHHVYCYEVAILKKKKKLVKRNWGEKVVCFSLHLQDIPSVSVGKPRQNFSCRIPFTVKTRSKWMHTWSFAGLHACAQLHLFTLTWLRTPCLGNDATQSRLNFPTLT